MTTKTTLLLAVLGLLSACANNESKQTTEHSSRKLSDTKIVFERLLGVWANEDGKSYERWTQNDDGSYLSVGFKMKGSDTVYTEKVYVHLQNGEWISENTVMEQNDGKAVQFSITELTQEEAHFSNPAHDFPTDIHYHLTDENTIQAYISGPNQSGSRDTIPFNFKRVEN